MRTHEERLAYMRHESAMLQRSRESVLAEIDEAIATHRPITYPQPGSSGTTRVDGGLTVAAAAKGIQPETVTGALGTDECQATNNTKQSPAAPSRSDGAAGSSARKRTAAERINACVGPDLSAERAKLYMLPHLLGGLRYLAETKRLTANRVAEVVEDALNYARRQP